MSLISTSTDSVTVSWSVPTGTVAGTFDLHWSVEGDQQPLTTSTDTVDTNQYIISGLSELENATVRIVVTTVNGAGRNSSMPLTSKHGSRRRQHRHHWAYHSSRSTNWRGSGYFPCQYWSRDSDQHFCEQVLPKPQEGTEKVRLAISTSYSHLTSLKLTTSLLGA